jgi:hypothetical protein
MMTTTTKTRIATSRIAGIVAVCSIAACLPAGNPPTGRHLLHGRNADSVLFTDAAPGAPSRILLSRWQANPGDVYDSNQIISTVDDPGAGKPAPAERDLLEHVNVTNCSQPPCVLSTDSLGRLYLVTQVATPSDNNPGGTEVHRELFRVDPSSGASVSLGDVYELQMSDDRTRTAAVTSDQGQFTCTVSDVSGGQQTLVGVEHAQFAGNDLLFTSAEHRLMRLRPDGQTDILAEDVFGFEVMDTDRGPLVMIRQESDMSPPRWGLFDVGAQTAIALPPATAESQRLLQSPSGRYVVALHAYDNSTRPMTLFDRDTGNERTESIPIREHFDSGLWRPGHDEFWIQADSNLWKFHPERGLAQFAAWGGFLPLWAAQPNEPIFTIDGNFWMGIVPPPGEKSSVFLHSADDANAEPLLLNPSGTGVTSAWPMNDGRLLVEDWIANRKRNDIYLADPAAHTLFALTTGSNIVAVGRDRMLAFLRWSITGSGDLTLIDFATGAQLLIAENVSSVAVDRSPSADDPLAPGTGVAFLVRNRIASPFDGLWVATLP